MHLRWFVKVRELLCTQTRWCEDNEPSELTWISIRGRQRDRLHRRHDGTETFRLLQTVLEVHRASALTGGKLARGRPQTAPRWPSASLHGLRQTSAGQQLLRLPCLGVCPRLGYDAVFGYPGATNGSWTDVDDSRNLQEGRGCRLLCRSTRSDQKYLQKCGWSENWLVLVCSSACLSSVGLLKISS